MVRTRITSFNNLPDKTLNLLIEDGYYPNSVPVLIMINMCKSLEISMDDAVLGMYATFDSVHAKPKVETNPNSVLWENKDALNFDSNNYGTKRSLST